MAIGQSSFIDDGFGANNPAQKALDEFEAFRNTKSSRVALSKPLIISIGSGINSTTSNSYFSFHKSKTMLAARLLVTNTQMVHREMDMMTEMLKIDYFRFEVDSGLEDLLIDSWKVDNRNGKKVLLTAQKINEATNRYLEQPVVVHKLRQCARFLVERCS